MGGVKSETGPHHRQLPRTCWLQVYQANSKQSKKVAVLAWLLTVGVALILVPKSSTVVDSAPATCRIVSLLVFPASLLFPRVHQWGTILTILSPDHPHPTNSQQGRPMQIMYQEKTKPG